MMKLPELQKNHETDDYEKFILTKYNEPLLEYVSELEEKLYPNSELKRLQFYFLKRYHDNLITQEFLTNQNFINEYYLIETIEEIGFDKNKFWYLVLFINDYAYCKCQLGVKGGKSPKATIDELVLKIKDNIVSTNESKTKIEVKNKMKLSLQIKDERKFVIDDERTIYYVAKLLESENSGDILIKYPFTDFREKLLTREDRETFTTHFWYFAHLFLKFFEAQPPKKRRSPNDSNLSYNKLLLISRIAYLVGLTDNAEYLFSDDPIKGILSKSQASKLKGIMNIFY